MSSQKEQELARFVVDNVHVIANAMQVYAQHMAESVAEARRLYDAGQADPDVRAAQNASQITNHGYRMIAELGQDSAKTATTVVARLTELTNAVEDERWEREGG